MHTNTDVAPMLQAIQVQIHCKYAPKSERAYLCLLFCQVEQSETTLHVPDVDESVADVGNGSLAHCLVASQWGTPATAEYAVKRYPAPLQTHHRCLA